MFKVGDLCEIVRCFTMPHLVGVECEVTGFGNHADGANVFILVNGFRSDHPTGEIRMNPEQLRLKDPPADDFTACEPEFLEQLNRMRGKVGV